MRELVSVCATAVVILAASLGAANDRPALSHQGNSVSFATTSSDSTASGRAAGSTVGDVRVIGSNGPVLLAAGGCNPRVRKC